MNDDERQARLAQIRARHVLDDFGMVNQATGRYEKRTSCKGCPWPCEQSVLLSELDALQARAERAEAALALAERESAEFSPWIAKMARTCRICDQVGLTGQIDHAPDCPFAALAAAGGPV